MEQRDEKTPASDELVAFLQRASLCGFEKSILLSPRKSVHWENFDSVPTRNATFAGQNYNTAPTDLHCAMASRVSLASIPSLTFYSNTLTQSRRTPPIAQLSCVGKPCDLFQPDVVRCVNQGGQGTDVEWSVSHLSINVGEYPTVLTFLHPVPCRQVTPRASAQLLTNKEQICLILSGLGV